MLVFMKREIYPLNPFYVGKTRRWQVFQELRLNLGMLRLGCETLRGNKLEAIANLDTPSYQRHAMSLLRYNFTWIWGVYIARSTGLQRWTAYSRGLRRVQAHYLHPFLKFLAFECRVRFRSHRWSRVKFFKKRIGAYSIILRHLSPRIVTRYRKIDYARMAGVPAQDIAEWPIASVDHETLVNSVPLRQRRTSFVLQGLSAESGHYVALARWYYTLRKSRGFRFQKRHGKAHVSINTHALKLIGYSGGHYTSGAHLMLFLSHTLELRAAADLVKLQYNALSVSCAMYISTKLNLLGYFHVDFDLAFGIDFKSYVIKMLLKLFNAIVSMHDYLSIAEDVKSAPSQTYVFQKPRTVSRGVFLTTFGTSGLRGEKAPYHLIKFKPGYPTFFRKLRQIHKEMNHLRFRYQHRMTTHLLKFQHLNNMAILKLSVLSIQQVLLHTKLFVNHGELLHAITHGFIFINGRANVQPHFQLEVGDYVQYRATYHTYSDVLSTFRAREAVLSVGHRLLGSYKYSPFLKGRFRTPRGGRGHPASAAIFHKLRLHRILHYYYHFFDTPAYIELDYMLLGFIVITLPNATSDFEFISMRKSSVTMLKMLNWKYIV